MAEPLAPRRVVTLIDEATGDRIPMEVYLELDVDDRNYALLVPVDLEVEVYRTVDEGGTDVLDPVETEELTGLRKHVTDALKQWKLKAEIRGGEMYIVGETPDDFFEDCEMIEVDTDEGPEEYVVVVQVETGSVTYLVTTPVVPDLQPAELDGDKARALNDDELADLEETFRAALKQFDDEDAGEGGSADPEGGEDIEDEEDEK